MKLALCIAVAAIAHAQPCTRDQLKSASASYFEAIEKRDSRPLWEVPLTENGKSLQPGEGFVQTGGKLHFARQLIDTERCAILTWGVIDETIDGATAPILIAARVSLDAGELAAIDTILHRKEERYFNPQAFIDSAADSAPTGPCQRWEGGVRTSCPAAIDREPTLADSETGAFAAATDSGIEVFQVRDGKVERIDAILGTH